MKFKNKKVCITGGNSGIGKAAALRFIQEGAHVAIIGRNQKTLDSTTKELAPNCRSYSIDVSKIQEIEKGLNQIHQDLGSIDVLFLNAGVAGQFETKEVTEEAYDQIMDINVKGPFFMLQKALPFLNEGSSVIATSSISSLLGIKHLGIYAASKAALNRLMIAFSAEFLEPKKIRFNIVSPGVTHTPIFDEKIQEDPFFLKKREASSPLKRLGHPKEIADAVLFLASEEAKYICGANLVIDGGISSVYPWKEVQDYYFNKN